MVDRHETSRLVAKLAQAELRQSVAALVRQLTTKPRGSSSIKHSCEEVLKLLCRKTSYTSENCHIIDVVVRLALEDAGEELQGEISQDLYQVLWDMGGQLHDSIQACEVAENFASTPQALLARLREMKDR